MAYRRRYDHNTDRNYSQYRRNRDKKGCFSDSRSNQTHHTSRKNYSHHDKFHSNRGYNHKRGNQYGGYQKRFERLDDNKQYGQGQKSSFPDESKSRFKDYQETTGQGGYGMKYSKSESECNNSGYNYQDQRNYEERTLTGQGWQCDADRAGQSQYVNYSGGNQVSDIESRFIGMVDLSPSTPTKQNDVLLGSPYSSGASSVVNPAREKVDYNPMAGIEQLNFEKVHCINLGGAARERYKWLISQGLDPSVARERAFVSINHSGSNLPASTKRQHSDSSTPKVATKKARSETQFIGGGSYRESSTDPTVGVCGADFPATLLTLDQMKSVREDCQETTGQGGYGVEYFRRKSECNTTGYNDQDQRNYEERNLTGQTWQCDAYQAGQSQYDNYSGGNQVSDIESIFTGVVDPSPPSAAMEQNHVLLGSPYSSGESTSSVEDSARGEVSPNLTAGIEQLNVEKVHDKKMSGAARKQYKWLLSQGLNPSIARERAQNPCNIPVSTKKRHYSDSAMPNVASKKARSETQTVGDGSYRESSVGTRVGVCDVDFPTTLLTLDQMKNVQQAFIAKITELPEGGVIPSYLSCSFRLGYMVLTCANETTAQWSLEVGRDLKPWYGANLKAIEEKDIPRSLIVHAFLPNSKERSSEDILSLLRNQNVDLFVNDWRIIKRYLTGETVHLIIFIDLASAEKLNRDGPKVNYLFGQAYLKLKNYRSASGPKSAESTVADGLVEGDQCSLSQSQASGCAVIPSSSTGLALPPFQQYKGPLYPFTA